jgi:class 3 adenylate cyclase
MSQSRRLAAILAADVAGYSRLMGFDEVGTARALRDHRAVAAAVARVEEQRCGRVGAGERPIVPDISPYPANDQ